MSITRRDILTTSAAALSAIAGRSPAAFAQGAAADIGPDRLVLLGNKGGPAIRG